MATGHTDELNPFGDDDDHHHQRGTEFSVIDLDAENEHFAICDSLISCIELIKSASDLTPATTTTTTSPPISSPTTLDTETSPQETTCNDNGDANEDHDDILCRQNNSLAAPTASAIAWSLIRKFSNRQQQTVDLNWLVKKFDWPGNFEKSAPASKKKLNNQLDDNDQLEEINVRFRGNFEWAPPRAQIIFNIHTNPNFKKLMVKQNYRCAGCGIKIDQEMARRLVLYCNYLGKYFCKCCHSHKAIHLPGYILQKWDFHKHPVSHFALQLLDRIANEPLFNINDTNASLYQKVKKLRRLLDVRMQLYYLKIYISTCKQTTALNDEYAAFAHQHLLQDEVHLYSLNNLIEIQHGKLFEYLNDLVSRSVAHVAGCDICRAKGHYCQLCGPSSLMGSSRTQSDTHSVSDSTLHNASHGKSPDQPRTSAVNSHQISGSLTQNMSPTSTGAISINIDDPELIFPFEIGRVAQCRLCGCCFHLQCFLDAGRNCPKCERIQRRKVEKSRES